MATRRSSSSGRDDKGQASKQLRDGEETPKARSAKRGAGRPRIRASHAAVEPSRVSGRRAGEGPATGATRRARSRTVTAGAPATAPMVAPGPRKAPLAGPRRTGGRRSHPPTSEHQASAASRELALTVAGVGLEKKAIGIEILDVSGKVDYAEFLVIMTGRSDRHVHAIASGLEESLKQKRIAPLSIEGLSAATWVLIDFGDVVVHVFQEEARRIYDIEGLWIDANRVPVPDGEAASPTLLP